MSAKRKSINKHNNNCNCPVCNNQIRDERQFAALQASDGGYITLDVEEWVHISDYQCSDNFPKVPNYTKIIPDDDVLPVIAYGVIIPQYNTKIKDWKRELFEQRNHAYCTLLNNQVFVSGYSDFVIFESDKVYNSHIPIALLYYTSLDLSEKRDYGFGYTSFLRYKDMDILTNIINRQYLFCLGGLESSFNHKDIENWKNYINKNDLLTVAERLF